MRRLRKQQASIIRSIVACFLLLYVFSVTKVLFWSVPIVSQNDSIVPSQQHASTLQPEFVFLQRVPQTTSSSNKSTPFCVDWSNLQTVDEWWSQRPTWEVALQNTTHQCFRPIANPEQAALYQQIHRIQFIHSSNECRTKIISNSGWGVDVSYMVDGLQYALQHVTPVHMKWNGPWQYAPTPCEYQDARCLFLPLFSSSSSCRSTGSADEQQAHYWQTPWKGYSTTTTTTTQSRWLLQYATRGQAWLRQQAVVWVESVSLPSHCDAAVHVRRADVILHGAFSRKYHKIREYVDAYYLNADNSDKTTPRHVLLLTDDANAIGEAVQYTKRTQLPWHWYYLDRPRFVGPQGGWENSIPSHDPAMEVAILYASVQMLQQCAVLVHSKSNLADYYYAWMQLANHTAVRRIDLDANRPHDQIHNAQNVETVRYSRAFVKN